MAKINFSYNIYYIWHTTNIGCRAIFWNFANFLMKFKTRRLFSGIEKPNALGLITPTKNNACAATEFLLNNLLARRCYLEKVSARDCLTNSRVRINYVNPNGERSNSREDRAKAGGECRHDNEPLNNCRGGRTVLLSWRGTISPRQSYREFLRQTLHYKLLIAYNHH